MVTKLVPPEIAGAPLAIASSTGNPKPSWSEGTQKTVAPEYRLRRSWRET